MSEIWHSVESLGRINSYFQLAVAVTGVLTAVLGALVSMIRLPLESWTHTACRPRFKRTNSRARPL